MRWFVYISFGGQKIILIVVLCAAMPLSCSSGCPHGTLPTHTLPFSLWSEGVILSVNSHGDVIGRLETHVSLFPYCLLVNRTFLNTQIYRRTYCLICLIIPTADALKVLSSRASSKRMMKVYFLSLTLTFRFLSRVSRSPSRKCDLAHILTGPITRWIPEESTGNGLSTRMGGGVLIYKSAPSRH